MLPILLNHLVLQLFTRRLMKLAIMFCKYAKLCHLFNVRTSKKVQEHVPPTVATWKEQSKQV